MKNQKIGKSPFLLILLIIFFPYVIAGAILYYCFKFIKVIFIGRRKIKTNNENYQTYLQSDHWKNFRKTQLIANNYQCQRCGSKDNLQVHHKTYKRRGHELSEDVIVVCNKCHEKLH